MRETCEHGGETKRTHLFAGVAVVNGGRVHGDGELSARGGLAVLKSSQQGEPYW